MFVCNHFLRECLAYSFAGVLQNDLDEYKHYWNTHLIRANRLAECPSGVPEEMYSLPHMYGKTTDRTLIENV